MNWAKIAKNPNGKSSKQLQEALEAANKEAEATTKELAEMQKNLKAAYLDSMAGETEANPDKIAQDIIGLKAKIEAINLAISKLEAAIVAAKKAEASRRLDEINNEIRKLREQSEKDYEKGLILLGGALNFLGSAWGLDPKNPPKFFKHFEAIWSTGGSGLAKHFASSRSLAESPKISARGKINELEDEKQGLEKALRVGSYAPSKPKPQVDDEPPAVRMGLRESGPPPTQGPIEMAWQTPKSAEPFVPEP